MSNFVDPKELLAAGAHFGHKTSRWHPLMAPYIHSVKNNIHIIDLVKTASLLEIAVDFVEKIASEGKPVMLVGTKRQAASIIKAKAEEVGAPYVTERWLGGMLTNHTTMSGRIKHLKKLEEQMENGELASRYNKLEVQRFQEEIDKLNQMFGGIKTMVGLPGAIVVVDTNNEKIAIKEARRLNIPVVGIADTNSDPSVLDYVVPANDDAIKTLQLLMDTFGKAITSGKAKTKKTEETKEGEK